MIQLNQPKVDSLRLIIPEHLVKVNPLHKEFLRNITKSNEDGEIIGETTCISYRLHSEPTSGHYERQEMMTPSGTTTPVIKLGFSSKLLKTNYFDGINKNNIQTILNSINQEGVIEITLKTLMNSRVVDTDICYDLILQSTDIKPFLEYLNELVVPRKGLSYHYFRKSTNYGLEFGKRDQVGRSYTRKQYLKFYGKSIELKYHSTKFYNKYIRHQTELRPQLIDEKLLRVETTIKNRNHWKTYNLEVNTLEQLLNLNLQNHLELFTRPLNLYLNTNKRIMKKTDLNQTEIIYLGLFDVLREQLKLKDEILLINHMVETYKKDRHNEPRLKQKLLELITQRKTGEMNPNQLNLLDEIRELTKT